MKNIDLINYKYILKFLAAIYIAWFASQFVLGYAYDLLIAVVVGVLFLSVLSLKNKFIILSLSAFFPFILKGAIGPLLLPKAIEFIAPVLFILLIIEILRNRQSLYSKKAFIYFAAIGVIILWSIISYIKYPLVGQAFGGGAEGGLRSYVTIFIGVLTFISCFLFFRYKELNAQKWLILLISIALLLSFLQLIGFFSGFHIPYVGGKFNTQINNTTELALQYSRYSYYRIGGLNEMVIIIIASLFTIYYKRRVNAIFILVLMSCGILLYLAGGRTVFFTSLFITLVYFILINRKYVFLVISTVLIISSVLIIVLPNVQLEGQIERLFAVKGGFAEQDKARSDFYRYYWEIFQDNLVLGKGIGMSRSDVVDVQDSGNKYYTITQESEEEIEDSANTQYMNALIKANPDLNTLINTDQDMDLKKDDTNIYLKKRGFSKRMFREGQVSLGGHGSYLSILNLFGLGGAFYLLVMIYGSMYYSYKLFKSRRDYDDDAKLALFVFLFSIYFSIRCITGGNGYNFMELWFLSGLIAGIRAKEGDRIDKNQQADSMYINSLLE